MSSSSIPKLKITDFSEDVHCLTKLKFRTVGIRWTIENYDDVCQLGKFLESADFPEGEEESQKWFLQFKPLKITPDSKETQAISLRKRFSGDFYVDTLLCIKDDLKRMLITSYKCLLLDGQEITYKFAVKNIYAQLLWNEIADKRLIVSCKIRIFDSTQPKAEQVYRKIASKFFECNDLSQDMSQFFVADQTFKDVIISVRGKTFESHKAVLAARSEVFAAMLTNEMREKRNSLIEIKDLTPEVVKAMLLFIYTDKVDQEDLKKLAPELLTAAEKYNLQRLKEMCIAAMYENMSVENVLNTLEVADLYSISNLKKEALKFLVSHRQVVKCQDEFKFLIVERPHLVVEMIDIQDSSPETSSDG